MNVKKKTNRTQSIICCFFCYIKPNNKPYFNNVQNISLNPVMIKKTTLKKSIFENTEYQKMRIKRNRKAARMLGLLIATFSVCWLPYTICYPLSHFYPNLMSDFATLFVWWLGYLNSAINPFLYVYSNKNIRRSVRNLFYKRIYYSFARRNRWDSFKVNRINY